MRADLLFTPPTPRKFSGVTIREPEILPATQAALLAQQILEMATEGKVAGWCVVELLPLLKQWHWDSYARLARIPSPTPEVVTAAIQMFRKLVQYPETYRPTFEMFPSS